MGSRAPSRGVLLAVLLALAWPLHAAAAPVTAPLGQPSGPGTAAPPTEEEAARVQAIAAGLRCVVCQALSVADSPSTTAAQMRTIILEQLREGKSSEAITAYFVSRYGEWVLLAPRRSGFNLVAWWLPFVGIALGIAGVVVAATRWVARGRAARGSAGGAAGGAEGRERLARELEGLRR